jgi:tetratricopeptide (TPR) repeat protein
MGDTWAAADQGFRALGEAPHGRASSVDLGIESRLRHPGFAFWRATAPQRKGDGGRPGRPAPIWFFKARRKFFKKSSQASPNFGKIFPGNEFSVYARLSAAYADAGRIEEANASLAEARRLNPKFAVKSMIEHMPNWPTVFDGIRKAELPEE